MNRKSPVALDLSAIEPVLRDRVRQRLAAITEFENAPSRQNAERLALTVGLKAAGFYNLVKAWRTLQDPMDLVGGNRPRSKRVSLEEAVQAIVDASIAELAGMQIDDVVDRIEKRALSRGIALPPRLRLKRYIIKHRPRRLPDEIAMLGDIVIDHSVVELPVASTGKGAPLRPLITAAVDVKKNKVLALTLSHGRPSAMQMGFVIRDAIGTSLWNGSAGRDSKLILGMPDLKGDAGLVKALEWSGFEVRSFQAGPYDHGKAIEALLGQINTGIRFLPRLVMAPDERRQMKLKSGKAVIQLEDAAAMVRHRLNIPDVAQCSFDHPNALDTFLDQAGDEAED